MATRVTFVTGTAEVKRREKEGEVIEPAIQATAAHVTGDRGNPYYSRRLDAGSSSERSMDSAGQSVTFVDGKCTCCPYGYHIDLDFLDYCKNVAEGSTLTNLRRIQRTKRKLRKSMEVMLQQQHHGDSATATLAATPPPDVVHSTEASRLINMVQYEQSATHQVLRDIDSSVNATLASIDTMQHSKMSSRSQRYMSSDSEDGFSPVSPMSGTLPHEQVLGGQYTSHASGMLNHPHEMATAQMRKSDVRHSHVTAMTSEKLAATMATHFPQAESDGRDSPSSPMSPVTTIGKASLAAIREAMAVSLQRMRDLEEQVKALPILQVRISVLKEEKRLLALQLKAKSGSPSVRSIGVGEDFIDSPDGIISASVASSSTYAYPTAASPFAPLASSPWSPGLKTPPATLPKPSRVKTVGVGDHSVVEPYLLQPDLPTGYTITDNQVQTEIRTTIHEKEMLFVDRGSAERRLGSGSLSDHSMRLSSSEEVIEPRAQAPVQTHFTINQIQRSIPRPMTRSIGVGEGNVHDTSLQIHEKELRTLIIGGSNGAIGKRNVGVQVRVPTRSVGVSYSCDDARPATRTIGVNVTYDTSGILTSLDFRGESELRTALRGVLQRSVHTVGTNCNFRPIAMDAATQHEHGHMISVGSGGDDCRVDVDIRSAVSQRTLGVTARPDTSNRMVSTDKDWVLDQGTNTLSVDTYNKASNTDGKKVVTAYSNTEAVQLRSYVTQTDRQVFQGMDQIKNVGSNTIPISTANAGIMTIPNRTSNIGVNTKSPNLVMENFDLQISFDDKGVNTPKQFRDTSVNTSERELQLSMSRVECVDVAASESTMEEKVQAQPLTLQEQILQRGSKQASAFISSTSSSGSLSPTSPKGRSSLMDSSSSGRTIEETTTYTTSGGPGITFDSKRDQLDGSAGGKSYLQSEVFSIIWWLWFGCWPAVVHGRLGCQECFRHLVALALELASSCPRVVWEVWVALRGRQKSPQGPSLVVQALVISAVAVATWKDSAFTKSSGGGTVSKTSSDMSGSDFTKTSSDMSGAGQGGGDFSRTSWDLSKIGADLPTDMQDTDESVTRSFTQTSESSVKGSGLSDSGMAVDEGVASLMSTDAASSLMGGQAVLVGGREGSTQIVEKSSSSSVRGGSPGRKEIITETVVKRSSPGSRLTKHRHSDGKITRDIALDLKGAYSGRRVGSVEDFMPDDMRRLMNIETIGSGAGSAGKGLQLGDESAGSKSGRSVTKTMRTVTTKRSSQGGNTVTSVTKTVTNPDGSVTTTTTSDAPDAEMTKGQGLGMLSSAQFDLSQIGGDNSVSETSTVESQSPSGQKEGGIKDSGYYESSTLTMSSSGSQEDAGAGSGGTLEQQQRELKSIMKRSKSDTANQKKGISFADSVVGGTGSSSESEASESDTESTTSFEEGSYDSREGDISYSCRDDEAIAQGLPGAKMYDQNIRETYELSNEMRQACDVLATYLVDSTTIQTKQLNASMTVVKDEWFRVSSHKLSSAHQVEDYLSSINEISNRLLEYVVNMVDNNGNAAIHYCVSHCNFDTVSLLLDTEVCDVKRPNKAGYTPIMLAALAYTGQTALMLAVSHGRTDMVQLLLEEGADCNIQDFDGSTALMCACEHGHTAIVQMLLAQPDCDASLTDNENSTALSIAMEAGHKDIGVILYKHLNFSKPPASPSHLDVSQT
ncbi:hypothetical protein BaRGS_00025300, partial [Batillaria attramentaria]